MKSSFRNIVLGGLAFVSTIIIAVMGYVLAGWSLLDAVYMSAITIFGVGYGEVRPITSPALRVFTILVSDIEVRGKGAFIVVALRKTDGTMIIHPKHEMLLEIGGTIIVMGHRGDIPPNLPRITC